MALFESLFSAVSPLLPRTAQNKPNLTYFRKKMGWARGVDNRKKNAKRAVTLDDLDRACYEFGFESIAELYPTEQDFGRHFFAHTTGLELDHRDISLTVEFYIDLERSGPQVGELDLDDENVQLIIEQLAERHGSEVSDVESAVLETTTKMEIALQQGWPFNGPNDV